ncbi:MAG TPA: protein kinase, partial [Nannocystis sp.]
MAAVPLAQAAPAGPQGTTRPEVAGTNGPTGEPEFPPSMQFAHTAIGDTALALSPSVLLSGHADTRDGARDAPSAPPLSGEFGPYQIVRQVGAGGMGAVYEAIDGRTGGRVAIKSLLRMGAGDLHRFKYEFRSMAGVGHPNLVTLYELVSHASTWCITMEFVEGVDLCKALRQRGRAAQLRGLVRQLALAIEALHAHNLLHRDLKPSNVLVTPGDRVVVLDFGLVAEISRTSLLTHGGGAPVHAGTPVYMAPEQCASQLATPASDWYALGVMLYEAVTGRLPFRGTPAQIFQAKQTAAPPVPAIPDDPALAALIAALLRRDPVERAAAAHVLAWCDGVSAPLLGPGASASHATGDPAGEGVPVPRARAPSQATGTPRRAALIARRAERAALEQAYLEAAAGRPTSVYLRGVSGAGKTALGQCFLADVAQTGEAVVLSGRCYEHESVPFKAFDSVIDALTEHLLGYASEELGPLLGAHCAELARLFPVLERIPAVRASAREHAARLGRAPALPGAEHESRRRAFAALKRLLYTLALRRPLVLAIDDLHWSDVDSLHLLRELLAPPEVPPLLLLAAYRSDWPGSAAARQELERIQLRVLPEQSVVQIELGLLPQADAEALARAMLRAAGLPTHPWARTIAAESGGNAFMMSAVVRHLSHEPEVLRAARLGAGVGLD